jgi:hypothetical protein
MLGARVSRYQAKDDSAGQTDRKTVCHAGHLLMS